MVVAVVGSLLLRLLLLSLFLLLYICMYIWVCVCVCVFWCRYMDQAECGVGSILKPSCSAVGFPQRLGVCVPVRVVAVHDAKCVDGSATLFARVDSGGAVSGVEAGYVWRLLRVVGVGGVGVRWVSRAESVAHVTGLVGGVRYEFEVSVTFDGVRYARRVLSVRCGLWERPPQAVAGSVAVGLEVGVGGASRLLDGSGSGGVSWRWRSFSAGMQLSVVSAGVSAVSVGTPAGEHAAVLRVEGVAGGVGVCAVLVSVNTPPVAAAALVGGAGVAKLPAVSVGVDGSGSVDVDGDVLEYGWLLGGVPAGVPAGVLPGGVWLTGVGESRAVVRGFTAAGSVPLQLVVVDRRGREVVAVLAVVVGAANAAPTAVLGGSFVGVADAGSSVGVTVAGSSDDGGAIASWAVSQDFLVVAGAAQAVSYSFTASPLALSGLASGLHGLVVRALDGEGAVGVAAMQVHVSVCAEGVHACAGSSSSVVCQVDPVSSGSMCCPASASGVVCNGVGSCSFGGTAGNPPVPLGVCTCAFGFISVLEAEGVCVPLSCTAAEAAVVTSLFSLISGWSDPGTSPCLWSGVSCTSTNVIGLDLDGAGLSGVLPDLSALSWLTRLVVSRNALSGEVPSLSGLSRLEFVDFRGNAGLRVSGRPFTCPSGGIRPKLTEM